MGGDRTVTRGSDLVDRIVQLHVRPTTVGATPLRPVTRLADLEALLSPGLTDVPELPISA